MSKLLFNGSAHFNVYKCMSLPATDCGHPQIASIREAIDTIVQDLKMRIIGAELLEKLCLKLFVSSQ
jgi:hypothetical protein